MEQRPEEGIQGEILEVFVIQTEEIDFFGALVRKNRGRFVVSGKVLYPNGKRRFFFSPEGEEKALRKNLVSLCQKLSNHYSTDYFHMTFENGIHCEEFIEKLRSAKQEVPYN